MSKKPKQKFYVDGPAKSPVFTPLGKNVKNKLKALKEQFTNPF